MPGFLRRGAVSVLVACGLALPLAAPRAEPDVSAGRRAAAGPGALPPEVATALDRARLPRAALVAVVEELGTSGSGSRRLWLQADRPVNPASLMKLLTTFAGLELLGPAWHWSTPVWLDGTVSGGVLDGNLVLKGGGDPTLVLERLWLLMRRVRQAGVREIHGDIVVDRSAFVLPPHDPGAFDGEPARPSNVGADALLLNYRSVTARFRPDIGRGVASISFDMPLANVRLPASVPLSSRDCNGDWRAGLQADFSDPGALRFAGAYPVACGEQTWPFAWADPARYDEHALAGLWQEMGGRLSGTVHDGSAPARSPDFEFASPPLADVIRDINKFSNNLMAQQLFLTLALAPRGVATPDAAREMLQRWAHDRLGAAATASLVIDNGSGLSREGRVSAGLLARLLQVAWAGPLMPELVSSLPLTGVDGTLMHSQAPVGQAHLKTGSLRDVSGVAGYVLGASGRRYALVGIVNDPNAGAARAVFDALVQWTVNDGGAPRARP